MAWFYLFALALVLWAACAATMAIGRRVWGLDTALRIHLAAAPVTAFVVSAIHKWIAPEFDSVLRAAAMTATITALDAVVVAPLFERSYAMFRSLIGTWLPFAAIFLASWVAGTEWQLRGKNGYGGRLTGMSAVPQIADDIGAPRKWVSSVAEPSVSLASVKPCFS